MSDVLKCQRTAWTSLLLWIKMETVRNVRRNLEVLIKQKHFLFCTSYRAKTVVLMSGLTSCRAHTGCSLDGNPLCTHTPCFSPPYLWTTSKNTFTSRALQGTLSHRLVWKTYISPPPFHLGRTLCKRDTRSPPRCIGAWSNPPYSGTQCSCRFHIWRPLRHFLETRRKPGAATVSVEVSCKDAHC